MSRLEVYKQLITSLFRYVYLMHVVQERKKFEFVEAILNFTQSWVKYYRKVFYLFHRITEHYTLFN